MSQLSVLVQPAVRLVLRGLAAVECLAIGRPLAPELEEARKALERAWIEARVRDGPLPAERVIELVLPLRAP